MIKTVIIEIRGGEVEEVEGLPPGWSYIVRDWDAMAVGEADRCAWCRKPIGEDEADEAHRDSDDSYYHQGCWDRMMTKVAEWPEVANAEG